MTTAKRFHGLLWALILVSGLAAAQSTERPRYDRMAEPDKQFVDVVLDLEQSIGQHNFAVVGHNEIGQAVRERGHPAFGDAAIVHFCNLEYARRAMDIDPAYILYMPCRIAVYESAGRIHAASLLLPEHTPEQAFNTFAVEINRQIREIVDYAVSDTISPDSG
ncbi:DUF302 domain-containing protein [Salinisphaera sp. T31B1]|uniref:DUF302 domain-containing protein n=1 Tax=Salinisphaera sp. T31B1 TaxID=727963 RepID=UPI0033421B14